MGEIPISRLLLSTLQPYQQPIPAKKLICVHLRASADKNKISRLVGKQNLKAFKVLFRRMDVFTNSHGNVTIMPKVVEAATLNTPSKPISTKIVSDTPGRLRLRIAPSHRQTGEMQRLVQKLNAQPNISHVKTNVHNGSIAIHYDRNDQSWQNVIATLKDIGLIFADVTTESHSDAAATVANAVYDLNDRVEQATNGVVDLRFIFPLALGCLSVRQLLVKGLQLEIIPWYVLAWYAFDSFIKLHGISKPQPSSASEK